MTPPDDPRRQPTRRAGDADAIEARVKKAAATAADRAGRTAARRVVRNAAPAYLLFVLVVFGGAVVWQRSVDAEIRHAGQASAGELRTGLERACERVNTLRVEEANRNAQVVWAALDQSVRREDTLGIAGHPNAELHRRSADAIRKYAAAMRWTPYTNCKQAVAHPRTYQPPDPRPFTPHFRDLRVVPGK